MKIKTNKLNNALSILSPVVSGESNIKIDVVDGNKLRLVASNNKIQIETICEAEIDGDIVSLCINADKLIKFSKSCSAEFIDIDVKNGKALLKSNIKSSLNILSSSSFPEIKTNLENAVELKINAKLFDCVRYACGNNDTRVFLNGISVSVANNMIRIMASDSFRSASLSDPIYTDAKIECIIQSEAASILSKTFKDEIDLALNKNSFSVTNGVTTITGKNIDAKYPIASFQNILNVERNNHVLIDSKLLLSAINSVTFIDKDVLMTFDNNKIELSSRNKKGESSDIEIECEYDGDKITIGIISNYLTDTLRNIDGIAKISFADNKSLVVTINDSNAIHLIAGKVI